MRSHGFLITSPFWSLQPCDSRDIEIGNCRQQGFLFCYGEYFRGLFLILEYNIKT